MCSASCCSSVLRVLCSLSVPCLEIGFSKLETAKTTILLWSALQIELALLAFVQLLADAPNAFFANIGNCF